MEFQKNIFDLTEEQEATSKLIYNGKIIKCLVAPYHTYNDLERTLPYTKTTFLFPEREMSSSQVLNFVSMLVAMPTNEEIIVVTASQNIIMDMVDSSVRILTENDEIVACPIKTFMANIHDIKYHILENKYYQKTAEQRNHGKEKVNDLINRVNEVEGKNISEEERNALLAEVEMVGEEIIRHHLKLKLSL